jgi:hypothetical protein
LSGAAIPKQAHYAERNVDLFIGRELTQLHTFEVEPPRDGWAERRDCSQCHRPKSHDELLPSSADVAL